VFDEKLKYASEKRGQVTPAVASVLSHIHRYRNESYHTGRVRPGILRTTVAIQLHLIGELVRMLQPGSAGFSSGEDFSWLKNRFGISPSALWDQQTLQNTVSEIRQSAAILASSVPALLAENLEQRIASLDEIIEFVLGETRLEKTHASAIRAAQEFTLKKTNRDVLYPPPPKAITKPMDGFEIERIRSVPEVIRKWSDDFSAFEPFAKADVLLDPVEYILNELAFFIDEQIQLDVDRAHGK
jgi:hypothetical protein